MTIFHQHKKPDPRKISKSFRFIQVTTDKLNISDSLTLFKLFVMLKGHKRKSYSSDKRSHRPLRNFVFNNRARLENVCADFPAFYSPINFPVSNARCKLFLPFPLTIINRYALLDQSSIKARPCGRSQLFKHC